MNLRLAHAKSGPGGSLYKQDMRTWKCCILPPTPSPFPSELWRTGQFFVGRMFEPKAVHCRVLLGDSQSRPYKFHLL